MRPRLLRRGQSRRSNAARRCNGTNSVPLRSNCDISGAFVRKRTPRRQLRILPCASSKQRVGSSNLSGHTIFVKFIFQSLPKLRLPDKLGLHRADLLSGGLNSAFGRFGVIPVNPRDCFKEPVGGSIAQLCVSRALLWAIGQMETGFVFLGGGLDA
jgi:hypothetical protein